MHKIINGFDQNFYCMKKQIVISLPPQLKKLQMGD